MATPGRPDGGQGYASGTANSAANAASDAAQSVKERAGAMFDDVKETAQSRLNEQKDVAADGIDDMAGALHDAARRRKDSAGNDVFSDLTDSAASGLDRLSGALRSKDVGGMLRDMESFARSQPLAFFGLSLAAGFLAVRFLKAGQPQSAGAYQGNSTGRSTSSYSNSDAQRRRLSNSPYREDPWTTR